MYTCPLCSWVLKLMLQATSSPSVPVLVSEQVGVQPRRHVSFTHGDAHATRRVRQPSSGCPSRTPTADFILRASSREWFSLNLFDNVRRRRTVRVFSCHQLQFDIVASFRQRQSCGLSRGGLNSLSSPPYFLCRRASSHSALFRKFDGLRSRNPSAVSGTHYHDGLAGRAGSQSNDDVTWTIMHSLFKVSLHARRRHSAPFLSSSGKEIQHKPIGVSFPNAVLGLRHDAFLERLSVP